MGRDALKTARSLPCKVRATNQSGIIVETRRYSVELDRMADIAVLDEETLNPTNGTDGQEMDRARVPPAASFATTVHAFVRFPQTNRSSSSSSSASAAATYDARLDRWYPLEELETAPSSSASPSSPSTPSFTSSSSVTMEDAARVWDPTMYEATNEMVSERLRCGASSLDFLEARLRRDIRVPPSVRALQYLDTYRVSLWYMSPLGALYSAYATASPSGPSNSDHRTPLQKPQEKRTVQPLPPPPQETSLAAPALLDVFLCPYTLRCFASRAELLSFTRRLFLEDQRRQRTKQQHPAAIPAAAAAVSRIPFGGSLRPGQRDSALRVPTATATGSTAPLGRTFLSFRPPGNREVYRDDQSGISLFEVVGREYPVYCRNVFLIGKSFLENKLAGHDVDLYIFYVLCLHESKHCPERWRTLTTCAASGSLAESLCSSLGQKRSRADDSEPSLAAAASSSASNSFSSPKDDERMLFAGYYSRELGLVEENLACIVVLPCFAAMGLGRFLIAASYEYSTRKLLAGSKGGVSAAMTGVGSPERPLSDLGQLSYYMFWRERIVQVLLMRCAKWVMQNVSRSDRDQQPFRQWASAMARFVSVRAMDSEVNMAALQAAVLLCRAKWLAESPPQLEGASSQQRREKSGMLKRDGAATAGNTTTAMKAETDLNEITLQQPPQEKASVLSDRTRIGVEEQLLVQQAAVVLSALNEPFMTSILDDWHCVVDAKRSLSALAQEALVAPADVLEVLLWCGLVHRKSDDELIVLLPLRWMIRIVEKRLQRKGDAPFVASALKATEN